MEVKCKCGGVMDYVDEIYVCPNPDWQVIYIDSREVN